MSPERSVTYVSGTDTFELVGAIGFEPTTPCAQGRCATRLRYAPTVKKFVSDYIRGFPARSQAQPLTVNVHGV